MAVGDDAAAANYPLVPDTGEEGRVRWGAREINRTRDFIAQVKTLIPTTMAGFRSSTKIGYGTSVPASSTGVEGEIYFRII